MRLRARLVFLRLRMRWPQRVRTARIPRMSECKRGCVFLQCLQGTGFSPLLLLLPFLLLLFLLPSLSAVPTAPVSGPVRAICASYA